MQDILDVQKQKAAMILDYLANGLSESDALTLVEWTEDEYSNYKKNNARYEQLTQRKKVEYKAKLMKPITKEIEKGDARLAQWMLERQFHNDFSNKKKPEPEQTNPIAVIINQIQNAPERSSLLPTRIIKKTIKEANDSHIISVDVNPDQITNTNNEQLDVSS